MQLLSELGCPNRNSCRAAGDGAVFFRSCRASSMSLCASATLSISLQASVGLCSPSSLCRQALQAGSGFCKQVLGSAGDVSCRGRPTGCVYLFTCTVSEVQMCRTGEKSVTDMRHLGELTKPTMQKRSAPPAMVCLDLIEPQLGVF